MWPYFHNPSFFMNMGMFYVVGCCLEAQHSLCLFLLRSHTSRCCMYFPSLYIYKWLRCYCRLDYPTKSLVQSQHYPHVPNVCYSPLIILRDIWYDPLEFSPLASLLRINNRQIQGFGYQTSSYFLAPIQHASKIYSDAETSRESNFIILVGVLPFKCSKRYQMSKRSLHIQWTRIRPLKYRM